MAFEDKPMASASLEKDGEGWRVITLNVGGVPKAEQYFRSRAEADTYLLGQYRLVREEGGL